MNVSKEYKKQLKNAYKEQEKQEFINNLPLEKEFFFELFEYLDKNSENENFGHNFDFTDKFLIQKYIWNEKRDEILEFLEQNGWYSDEEILFNVLEKFEEYFDFFLDEN